jgi:hypothetical protein
MMFLILFFNSKFRREPITSTQIRCQRALDSSDTARDPVLVSR